MSVVPEIEVDFDREDLSDMHNVLFQIDKLGRELNLQFVGEVTLSANELVITVEAKNDFERERVHRIKRIQTL